MRLEKEVVYQVELNGKNKELIESRSVYHDRTKYENNYRK